MRLVVDTNLFVGAALKENSLPFLVARWIDRHDGLLKSAATKQQLLLDVPRRPYMEAATIPSLRQGLARMLARPNWRRSPSASPPAAIPPTTNFSSWRSTATRT
jgi:hypothetical protein